MDRNYEIFEIWAPSDGLWSPWAKPILFTNLRKEEEPLSYKTPEWLVAFDQQMMIVLDVEGDKGVKTALGLALLGYRPVPLYNGALNTEAYSDNVQEKYNMAVDPTAISKALYSGSRDLALLPLSRKAPPVFMLDSARLPQKILSGTIYDNRWTIFPQDFPSATFLKNQGINKVLVRQDKVNDDLLHVLYRYKEKGLEILTCSNSGAQREYLMPIPPRFRQVGYRAQAFLGLTSNSTGGFGKKIAIDINSGYRGG